MGSIRVGFLEDFKGADTLLIDVDAEGLRRLIAWLRDVISSGRKVARATDLGNSRVNEVTELLRSWRQGDAAALDRLIPLVHGELRRVARSHFRREPPGHTLQATALVHEVYLRLVAVDRVTLNDRTHFFAVAAKLMRQILVDHARRKRANKRARGVTMLSLDEVSPVSSAMAEAWLYRRLSIVGASATTLPMEVRCVYL